MRENSPNFSQRSPLYSGVQIHLQSSPTVAPFRHESGLIPGHFSASIRKNTYFQHIYSGPKNDLLPTLLIGKPVNSGEKDPTVLGNILKKRTKL